MTLSELDQITWRDPWYLLTSDVARRLGSELQRELCPEHVLFGCPAQAVARRCDHDDTLFQVAHPKVSFAVVHLTFQVERDPRWPGTQLLKTLEEFVEVRLLPDAMEYDR